MPKRLVLGLCALALAALYHWLVLAPGERALESLQGGLMGGLFLSSPQGAQVVAQVGLQRLIAGVLFAAGVVLTGWGWLKRSRSGK